MFLKDQESGELVKILELENLFNPTQETVTGQIQGGQAEQPSSSFNKEDLIFPSGESLPRCWLDADYRLNSPPE